MLGVLAPPTKFLQFRRKDTAMPKVAEKKRLLPLYDRVLIEPITETETALGLALPASTGEHPWCGRVVAVGSGKIDEKGNRHRPDVAVGDVVYFPKFGTSQLTVDSVKYIVLKDTDILAVEDTF